MKLSKEIKWIIAILAVIMAVKYLPGMLQAVYVPEATFTEEDTYVAREFPDTNYINSNTLKIGTDKWIYLKFKSIYPAGKKTDWVRICLYATSVEKEGHIQWQYTDWGTAFDNETNETVPIAITWNIRIVGKQSLKSQYIDKLGYNCEIINIAKPDFSLVGMTNNLEAEFSSSEGVNKPYAMVQYSDIPLPPSPKCGDGTLNQAAEECDDGNNVDRDGCSANCLLECKWWQTKKEKQCKFNPFIGVAIAVLGLLIILKWKDIRKRL